MDLTDKKVLLIISGGIAAYKALELIRQLSKAGATVTPILTKGAQQFITPLSAGALSGQPVYTELFSLKDETEMGHIRLSRESDLIIVAPASASLMARMAHGLADDLAATILLASNKPVMIAPAMNPAMWNNAATRDNLALLKSRGIKIIGPAEGDTACGELGLGRMVEPEEILKAVTSFFSESKPLSGYKALVTSGPTYEPLDPVRFIGNRSSGKQGHAIARALRDQGADVTLVTGPVALPAPDGVNTVPVETASEMLAACQGALPVDIAVCAAAVSDWAAETIASEKTKKAGRTAPPVIKLKENPDILATLAAPAPQRPALVIGFAAETQNLLMEAARKKKRKNCDWLVANDVSGRNGKKKVFGAEDNHVYLLTGTEAVEWTGPKDMIAGHLSEWVAEFFKAGDKAGKKDAAKDNNTKTQDVKSRKAG